MENNQAFIAKIGNIQPIEGADKIVKASILLDGIPVTNVVVGVDTQDGQEVVYFDSNMCLVKSTILTDYPELERYLGKNGRVKTIKLKGTYSDGLAVDVEKFYRYFKDEEQAKEWLTQGKTFNEIGDVKISYKYEPPRKEATKGQNKKGVKGKKISRLIEGQFHFHIDTDQLPRNIHDLNPDDVISISRKIHGTSSIVSNCLVQKKLKWYEKVLKAIGLNVIDYEYDYIFASRRVVKNEAENTGFYDTDIWTEAGSTFAHKLAQGETAYFEIVGYLPSGAWIQKNYDYGNIPGKYSLHLYRMTKTGPDGDVTEYSWPLLKEKANWLGIPLVEEFYYGAAKDLYPYIPVDEDWHGTFLDELRVKFLEKKVEENLVKKVPDEGIVLRIEAATIRAYKLKSMSFLQHETKMYEEGSEDIESEG